MQPRSKFTLVQLALLAALFIFVTGGRWAVIDHFGSDLPYWDQWDAEGTNLLSRWTQHKLTVAMLVDHHNEHRVVLSRLLALGLTLANGQWDQRLECVVNAFLPAAVAAGFLALALRNLDRKWLLGLVPLLMAGYGLPIAWENILRGFDSQQYFLIALSFGAIVWLPSAAPWSGRFWLGAVCAAAALGSMATGFFASVIVAGLLLLRWAKTRSPLREIWPALAVGVAVAAIGGLTQVTVPYHAYLHAHTFDDFFHSVRNSLQWPSYAPTWAWMAVLAWLPWAGLTAKIALGRSRESQPLGPILAGLGGWVILQVLATAYARGADGPMPASRYEDTLVFGAIVNALAIAWLWEYGGFGPRLREALPVAGTAWIIAFGLAAIQDCLPIFRRDLPDERKNSFYCEQNTRNYLATGDEAYLRHDEIPYPGSDLYLSHLRAPGLIPLLPASVRLPLPMAAAPGGTAFVEYDSTAPEAVRLARGAALIRRPTGFSPGTPPLDNRPTWGSYGIAGAAAVGDWESRPLTAHRGWLKIEMAGQPGAPEVGLELRDAGTGRRIAQVRPDRTPGDSWRAAYVRAPARPFVLVAWDRDPTRWFAFSAPVEMGSLSHAAWRAMRHGLLLAEIAGLAALALALAESRRRLPV